MSASSDHWNDLDDPQRAAATAPEPRIAVIAGPGSGKTRVLSLRCAFLLASDAESRALLLTFTNKAAAEMKARAVAAAATPSRRITAGTFHTFAVRLLRDHGDLVGIDREFEILDSEGATDIARQVADDALIQNYRQLWSYLRVRRESPRESEVAEFGRAFQAAKLASGGLDFDDLLVEALRLVEEHPDVADAYAARYRHILVDEFQDTNRVQFDLIQALAAGAQTLSVFADDDQAIYRFAGADSDNVHRFVSELGATVYPLVRNYRCRTAIVDAANRLIASDPLASGRTMEAVVPGGEVRTLVSASLHEEAARISLEIQRLLADGVDSSEIAVLVRTRSRAGDIVDVVAGDGVPVVSWLDPPIDPPERRLMAACLSVVRPRLQPAQQGRLISALGVPEADGFETLSILTQCSGRPGVAELLQVHEMVFAGAEPVDVVQQAAVAACQIDPALSERVEAIVTAVRDFAAHDPDFALDQVLTELALGGVGGSPTATRGVKVASLHRTKGLQWRVVYLLGLEEGRLPFFKATAGEELREERRVCFVGVCRAEQLLVLARVRTDKGWLQHPSRFLGEMGV